ncbi:MAG: hypothetical protein Q8P80_03005 [Candidatus Levybacteria bacterium]|nr:hypothetical protein [Candidatus Levybacteria bacterium]
MATKEVKNFVAKHKREIVLTAAGLVGLGGTVIIDGCGSNAPATQTPDAVGTKIAQEFDKRGIGVSTPTVGKTETPAPTATTTAKPTETATAVPTAAPETNQTVESMKNLWNTPAPKDFRPEVAGGMQNKQVKDWQDNVWTHLMPRADRVDTYATYWAKVSKNINYQSHGNDGEIIAQIADTQHDGTIVLGVGTLKEFTDSKGVKKQVWLDKKTGTEAGYRQDLPTGIHIKGIVNLPAYVFNADTKELVAQGAGNEFGDLTVDVPNEGRIFIVIPNLNDPTKSGGVREVSFRAGLDDYFGRADKDINRIDARSAGKAFSQAEKYVSKTGAQMVFDAKGNSFLEGFARNMGFIMASNPKTEQVVLAEGEDTLPNIEVSQIQDNPGWDHPMTNGNVWSYGYVIRDAQMGGEARMTSNAVGELNFGAGSLVAFDVMTNPAHLDDYVPEGGLPAIWVFGQKGDKLTLMDETNDGAPTPIAEVVLDDSGFGGMLFEKKALKLGFRLQKVDASQSVKIILGGISAKDLADPSKQGIQSVIDAKKAGLGQPAAVAPQPAEQPAAQPAEQQPVASNEGASALEQIQATDYSDMVALQPNFPELVKNDPLATKVKNAIYMLFQGDDANPLKAFGDKAAAVAKSKNWNTMANKKEWVYMGKVKGDGSMEAGTWAIATNLLVANNVSVYQKPGVEGQLFFRLAKGQTKGYIVLATSINSNFESDKTGGDPNQAVTAIIRNASTPDARPLLIRVVDFNKDGTALGTTGAIWAETDNDMIRLAREGKITMMAFEVIDPRGEQQEGLIEFGSDSFAGPFSNPDLNRITVEQRTTQVK